MGQARKRISVAGQKIRIRLKAYDHEAIDASAKKIVETYRRREEEKRIAEEQEIARIKSTKEIQKAKREMEEVQD